MKVITYSEARKNFKAVIDSVAEDADYTIIARRDADDAIIMSLDHYNGLMETLYLLQSPANAAHLFESLEQFRRGEIEEHELINE